MKKTLLFLVLLTFGMVGCSEKVPITFDETTLTADKNGSYEVTGTQELDAIVHFDDKVIDLSPDEEGTFKYSVSPEEPKDTVTVSAQLKKETIQIKLKVDNTKYKAYQKQLAEEERLAQEAKEKAEKEKKIAIQKATDEAKIKIETAEKKLTRDTLSEVQSFVDKIPDGNEDLSNRLVTIEETITENEKLAEEKKERERIAAEQAETERKRLAEQAAIEEKANKAPVAQTVYVAPQSGTKYHFNQSCRGLNNANSVSSLTLSATQSQGYGLCGWED